MAYEQDCLFGNSDGNAETTRQEIMMSTCGRSALVDIREQPLSARFRNTKEQQHLQLAFVTLKACFAMVLSKKQRDDVLFYENLFTLVFKDCSDRRMLLEGLQELLMYCPDDAAVAGQKDTVRQWLKQPRTILTLARDAPKPFGTTNEYEDNLWESIRKNFQKSSTDHRYRSLQKDRVITRLVVFMKLKKFHASASSVATQIDPAAIDVGSQKRKASTTTQDSIIKKRPKILPIHVSTDVDAEPSLLCPYLPPSNTQRNDIVCNIPPPGIIGCAGNYHIPYDSPSRWDMKLVKVATSNSMRVVTARLVVETDEFNLQLYHSPVELYVAWDLQRMPHQFEVVANEATNNLSYSDKPTLIIPDCGPLHTSKPYLVVSCPGNPVFEECFPPEFFQIDLHLLVHFIFEKGTSDSSRSSPSMMNCPVLGSRYDFGNSGQAMEPGLEVYRPKTLCKCQPLLDYPNGERL